MPQQVGQEKGLLPPTEISSLEYKSETKSNIGSVLSAQEQSLPILPPLTSLSPSPPPPYTMSQHDLNTIIRQQQEQLVAMQVQIQALLAGEVVLQLKSLRVDLRVEPCIG